MAGKKPFRLRTVLRYKQQVEEHLQEELRHLAQALAEAEALRLQQQEQHARCLCALRQREGTGVSAAELLTYSAFLEHLSGQISQQTQVIVELHEQVQQGRQRLEQAMKDRKIIEKLQERERTAQKQQIVKDEDRAIAEIALRRFAG